MAGSPSGSATTRLRAPDGVSQGIAALYSTTRYLTWPAICSRHLFKVARKWRCVFSKSINSAMARAGSCPAAACSAMRARCRAIRRKLLSTTISALAASCSFDESTWRTLARVHPDLIDVSKPTLTEQACAANNIRAEPPQRGSACSPVKCRSMSVSLWCSSSACFSRTLMNRFTCTGRFGNADAHLTAADVS